jgi:hypothetical protein
VVFRRFLGSIYLATLFGCGPTVNVTVPTSTGDLVMNCVRTSTSVDDSLESFLVSHSNSNFSNMPVIDYRSSTFSRSFTIYDSTTDGKPLGFSVSDSSAISAIDQCRSTYDSWDNAL